MTSPRENRPAVLAAVLAQALPGAAPHRIAEAVTAMTAAAKAHKRAAEHECNYPTDEAWQRRMARQLATWADLAADSVCATVGGDIEIGHKPNDTTCNHFRGVQACGRALSLDFGGDPRGPCGVLFISDRDGDSYAEHNGRRGWAIYE